ncbi:hypothetical protein QR680_014238 [Steinernema hermaphroditum]|uniref:Malate dehydrogenase n=1 Tax=Steinernema hermaphroditum TaxID=289476 RepID=A0AA39M3K4_9BILA|nr:hypothetical protein QR680_014238 [Steinernema hermaphroditum]
MALSSKTVGKSLVASGLRVASANNTSSAPKVALLGANGEIGKLLALLLVADPNIASLALYHPTGIRRVAADISQIDSVVNVTGHTEVTGLQEALKNANIVVIAAEEPRKPGMTNDNFFDTNARLVSYFAAFASAICPSALVAIITNPVNSMVPVAVEVFKKKGVYDPNRIFGVTTLDVVRSQVFVKNLKNLAAASCVVPVIGGHSGKTTIPVFSMVRPKMTFTEDEVKELTKDIRSDGIAAQAGATPLAAASAGARFLRALVSAVRGYKMTEFAYVYIGDVGEIFSTPIPGVEFFSAAVELGPNGVEKILGLGNLNAYEKKLVAEAIPELKKEISKGVAFIEASQIVFPKC